MTKYLAIFFIAIAVVAGGLFLYDKLERTTSVALAAKPWIEVVSPSVAEINDKGEIVRQLATGDELAAGSIIEGKAGSFANIYFPDGSAARIDGATKISLDEYFFDESSDHLVVRLSVAAGHLWNKIFELATPDSVWEVKTATAVATVRGTSFGVAVSDGQSSFIGSQNNVEVAPVDPETKQVLKEAKAIISAGDVLQIAKDDIQLARKESKTLALKVQKVTQAAAAAMAVKEDWIAHAKSADADFDNQVSEIRKTVKEKQELRRALRESIRKVKDEVKQDLKNARDASVEDLKAVKNGLKQGLNILPASKILERVVQERLKSPEEPVSAVKNETQEPVGQVQSATGSTNINTSGGTSFTATRSSSKPLRIKLESSNDFSKAIKEGTQVFFKAILVRADGSSEVITDVAEWKVVGSIGAIGKAGTFLPRLGDDIAEFGTGVGTVVATWKDSASGEVFLGQSPVITVEPAIVPAFSPDGG